MSPTATLIDYRLESWWRGRTAPLNFRNVTRFDLNTAVMTGDQFILIGGNDFSYIGYEIPLLEFTRSLVLAMDELSNGALTTEASPLDEDQPLTFTREGSSVSIASEISTDSVTVEFGPFRQQVCAYARRLLTDLLTSHPEAARSGDLMEWYPVVLLGATELFSC